MTAPVDDRAARPTIGLLGPFGSFTDQALRSQLDLADHELRPFASVPDVLDTVAAAIDLGFVPIENSIEGSVNFTQDALFAHFVRSSAPRWDGRGCAQCDDRCGGVRHPRRVSARRPPGATLVR